MDVSAVSSTLVTSASTGSSGSGANLRARIQLLAQQIAQLESNNTLDPATKQQWIQALEAQIQKLEAQLNSASQPQVTATSASETATTASATSDTIGTLFSAYA